jgi:ribosomal protein L24E
MTSLGNGILGLGYFFECAAKVERDGAVALRRTPRDWTGESKIHFEDAGAGLKPF